MVSHFFCSIILSKKSKMTISIELDDRQYRDIELYCNMNNIKINDYLTDIITEKHMINKYGDLNDIMPVAIEEDKTKIKKPIHLSCIFNSVIIQHYGNIRP